VRMVESITMGRSATHAPQSIRWLGVPRLDATTGQQGEWPEPAFLPLTVPPDLMCLSGFDLSN